MNRVLVTGAYGFVGTHLVRHLAAGGTEVWALDLEETFPAGADSGVRRFTWDGLEEIPWGELDAVVHLAGKAHDMRRTADPKSYFDVNVGLTQRVVDCCAREPNLKAFVLFSSVKAAADHVEGVLTEDAAPNPRTPYGQSKLEAERVVREAFARDGAARYYLLRSCMIHGPGTKGNLNLLCQFARRGWPWPLGAFDNRRSFASIDNVCMAVAGLLQQLPPSGVYQMADDEALSTNELIKLLAESCGQRPRIGRVNPALIRSLARWSDRLRLPLTSERLDKLTENYVVSNAKLLGALGISACPVSVREGLQRTFASFKNGHGNPRPKA